MFILTLIFIFYILFKFIYLFNRFSTLFGFLMSETNSLIITLSDHSINLANSIGSLIIISNLIIKILLESGDTGKL